MNIMRIDLGTNLFSVRQFFIRKENKSVYKSERKKLTKEKLEKPFIHITVMITCKARLTRKHQETTFQ